MQIVSPTLTVAGSCPCCGYDLRGASGPQCSECGVRFVLLVRSTHIGALRSVLAAGTAASVIVGCGVFAIVLELSTMIAVRLPPTELRLSIPALLVGCFMALITHTWAGTAARVHPWASWIVARMMFVLAIGVVVFFYVHFSRIHAFT